MDAQRVILILTNILFIKWSFAGRDIPLLTSTQVYNNEIVAPMYEYQTKSIKVPVDHFSFSLNDTFDIRYLFNDTWQKGQNPAILFYTGNEGDIELFARNTGFMWEIAPAMNALLIFAEHRYYGHSMPYGNESFATPKNLGYLTSQQALADFADVITFLKRQPSLKNSPVIVFGGSYGGMLSAWMRMKYPHLVLGAIAASAPILQFSGVTPCETFSRITTAVFRIAGTECAESVRKSWSAITKITSEPNGMDWLSKNWKLCAPLKNATDLKAYLTDVYGNLAMINYPYESDFLAPVPAYPVKAFCSHLTDSKRDEKDLLLTLNKALSVFTNYTGGLTCLDINKDATPQLGDRGWDYQACTEMVMPMCSNGVDDMFEPSPWNIKSFSAECEARYNVKSRPYFACEEYGCQDFSAASNIIFSNGLLDPWSGGGVLRNVSALTTTIIIPEGAHHLDLRASNPNDPLSVVSARKIHKRFIKKWIKNYRRRNSNNGRKSDL